MIIYSGIIKIPHPLPNSNTLVNIANQYIDENKPTPNSNPVMNLRLFVLSYFVNA